MTNRFRATHRDRRGRLIQVIGEGKNHETNEKLVWFRSSNGREYVCTAAAFTDPEAFQSVSLVMLRRWRQRRQIKMSDGAWKELVALVDSLVL